MSILGQLRLSMFGNRNNEVDNEVDIPDFLKRPQDTRVIITELVLQEFMRHAYRKGVIAGWACGFMTGILVPLIIGAILISLGII